MFTFEALLYQKVLRIFLKSVVLISAIILVSSCKVTKNVPEGKLLLKKNKVTIEGDHAAQYNLNPYIVQRPNSKSQLLIYNLANQNYEKNWKERLQKYTDSAGFFTRLLSLKQMIGLANFNKNINLWLIKSGQAPVIIDELKAKRTLKSLNQFYIDQGYFKVKSSYDIDTLSEKNGRVNYKIIPDKPFYIDSIFEQIASPVIDSLYQKHKSETLLKSNQMFKREHFEKEAERLTNIFRNAGVYHFNKYSINFRDIDSTNTDYKTNVLLDISNRIIDTETGVVESDYKINYIHHVNVYTDYSYQNNTSKPHDSITYNGINFYAYDRLKFKPKYLTQNILIKPTETFSDNNLELTRTYLRNLNTFKSIRINYVEENDSLLTANILLTPNKQFSVKAETEVTHSNIKPFGLSGKLSFRNNNTFHGNEILQLSLQGSFLNTDLIGGNIFRLNAWEFGSDLSYKVPRILFPAPISKTINNSMLPKTNFSFGMSFQSNIGLDKRRITGIMEYQWQSKTTRKHSFELINTQFIKNLNTSSYFDIYSSEYIKLIKIQQSYFPDYQTEDPLTLLLTLLTDQDFSIQQPDAYRDAANILYRYGIITEDVLVNAISYGFEYSNQANFKDFNYQFFRIRLSSAGLLSSILAQKNSEGTKQLFGTSVAQYAKLDVEYKKYWDLNRGNVLVLRSNIGIAIPYKNSEVMPFSRSYFAGGTNDIRAWKIYDLGPGSERLGLEYNVGNLKFLTSIEHRFNILNSLKGALFVDMGNIWELSNNLYTTEEAKFKGFNSIKEIAIGNGFGLRYDFSFLVFRADLAFKTYKPYETAGNQWFNEYNFKNAQLNIGINYPF